MKDFDLIGIPPNFLDVIYPEFYEVESYEDIPGAEDHKVNKQVDAIRFLFHDEGVKQFETWQDGDDYDPKGVMVISNQTASIELPSNVTKYQRVSTSSAIIPDSIRQRTGAGPGDFIKLNMKNSIVVDKNTEVYNQRRNAIVERIQVRAIIRKLGGF